jgi:hypothetical protein
LRVEAAARHEGSDEQINGGRLHGGKLLALRGAWGAIAVQSRTR